MLSFCPEKINPYIIRCGHMNKSNCPPAGMVYEKRQVKWYEVELILWGEGTIITEGERLQTKRGDIFFRRPNMIVQGISPYYCYIIMFDMMYTEAKWNQYCEPNAFHSDVFTAEEPLEREAKTSGTISMDFPWVMHVKQFDRFEELFKHTYEESVVSRAESHLILKSNMLQILTLMYSEHMTGKYESNPSRSFQVNYPKIMKTKLFIENNININFSLSQLADLSGLSPTFFCKIFKEVVGLTPINFINKCRMNQAKRMLLETNQTVKEISFSCGFENESYFYSLFKRYENSSPLEFRTRQRLGLF